MNSLYADITKAAPLCSVTLLALILLAVETLVKRSEKINYWISLVGLLLSAGVSAATIGYRGTSFNSMLIAGGYASGFEALFSVAALMTLVLSADYFRKEGMQTGEVNILVVFSTLGMMLMAAAADLIVIFLGLELMSICLYILVGSMRRRMLSNESALKYFLLGAFATGFLLYGIALIYGAAKTTNIPFIIDRYEVLESSAYFWVGSGLLLVGLAFKVGAVPFHMWVPDVYQGAPTTITGFMSTGAKAAAFSAFVILFAYRPSPNPDRMKTALAVISAASMIIGNIVALSQTNIKRMLAYSSIAHAGYMLTGLAAANQLGRNGIFFYLVAYTFMNIGAFGILALFEKEGEKNLTFADYAGLGAKKPFMALMMSVFMLSLAGIPPFAGFFGKYYVFVAAVNADLTWLVVIGVITSVISVYYYLRLVVVMYFQEGEMQLENAIPAGSIAVLAIAAFAILGLGIYPSSLLSVINNFR